MSSTSPSPDAPDDASEFPRGDEARDEALSEDERLYARIWRANRDEEIDIGVDLKRANRPSSSLYRMSDNAVPFFGLLSAVIAVWGLAGWVWALAAFASGIILLLTVVNMLVMRRIRRRALDQALGGLAGWEELWSEGLLSLRRRDGRAGEASAPADSWRRFAGAHMSGLGNRP